MKLAITLVLLASTLAVAEPDLRAKLPALEKAIGTLLNESHVPGTSVGIVYKGEVIFLKGFGVREAGRPESVDADTVFQLASCSKPITSTAVAALVSQHKLRWDDPVVKYLPDFRLSDEWVSQHATMRDMLSHRSGLPGYAGDLLESLGLDRDDVLQRLHLLAPAYPFRSGYAYTNFGYTVGGEAAARASGQTFEDMLQKVIFNPLGMTSTSARFSDFTRNPNHAHTHMLTNGTARATVLDPQPQAPAGGVSSSARDMIRWAQFHLDQGKFQGQQLIARADLAETQRIHCVTSNNPADLSANGYYGMGWGLAYDAKGRYLIKHSGMFSLGARTEVTLIPQEQLGVVVLANAFPSGLPEAISSGVVQALDSGQVDLELMRKVDHQVTQAMGAMLDRPALGVSGPSAPPLPLTTYVGDYTSAFLGPAKITLRGDRLVVHLGKQDFGLTHQTRDSFLASPLGGPNVEIYPFRLTFLVDPSGHASGFRQDGLDPVDSPFFTRKP